MNLLIIGKIRDGLTVPDFGPAFHAHLEAKHNPALKRASLNAWHLLAQGLRSLGLTALPTVEYTPSGKPVFSNAELHFSLSHSADLAAALISSAPCGVDLELIQVQTAERLYARCLSTAERQNHCDFFEIWTKKEAAAKLTGDGMPSRPAAIDTLSPAFPGHVLLCRRICDDSDRAYAVSALSFDPEPLKILYEKELSQ